MIGIKKGGKTLLIVSHFFKVIQSVINKISTTLD